MANRFTKCDTLVSVTGGIFEGTLGETGTTRGVDQAFHFKVVHDVEEAHAFFADHIAFVHFDIIKIDFAGAEHVPTNLMQWINLNAGFLRINPPQRKGFFRVFRLGIACQYQHIRVLFSAGDKGFLPIEIHFTVFAGVAGGCAVIV